MLRLKYGILNEADDDEEDENKKNLNFNCSRISG